MGEIVIMKGYLYSCDSFECPKCSKRVIGSVAAAPICEESSDRADRIIDDMKARGYSVYGIGAALKAVEKYIEDQTK